MEIIDRMKAAFERADGWINLVTGAGTRDRSKRLDFAAEAVLPDAQLEALFAGDPYASRICRVVPEEALRQGYRVTTGDAGEEASLAAALESAGADEQLLEAWTFERVFGGAAIFVGADDGRDPSEPLDEANIRSVRFLTVLDRRELQPADYYREPRRRKFGDVETYRITRSSQGGVAETALVHETRLIRFPGGLATRRRRQHLQGWGESELNRVYNVLAHFNGAFEATGTLLQQSSESVFKISGLMAMMAADKRDLLKTRLEMMDLARSVSRSVLIDANEEYTRTEVGALTGVASIIDKNLLYLSGAAEIPVTILMGQSPAGLSATGDSDVRWFYDRIKSAQTNRLRPRQLRLIRLLCLAKDGPTGGRLPPKLAIAYASLWQPTPLEQSQIRANTATADVAYVTAQIVTADEVAVSRFRPEGYSAETTIDLGAREVAQQADRDAAQLTGGAGAPGADHAEGAAAIIAKVAGRELPRDAGVALLQQSMGLAPDAAEAAMGEAGRSFFTAPEAGHAAEMDAMKADLAKAQRSLVGHKAYTARLIQRAKDGGLELGAFTSQAPTETAEGDELAVGDVVAVPVEDDRLAVRRMDGGTNDGVAVVLRLPRELAAQVPASPECAPDLHVTLCYLGKLATLRPGTTDRVVEAVRQWAATVGPIAATLGGIGRFVGSPEGDPVYVPVDSEAITDSRPALVALLRDVARVEPAKGHGFTPHLTIAYVGEYDPTPDRVAPFSVEFGRVSVWAGEQRVDVDLTGGA
jgi:phage-related protein (TIGR01555 family)